MPSSSSELALVSPSGLDVRSGTNLQNSGLTSSSASRLKIQSRVAFSIAEFFCAAKPFQDSGKTRAPKDFAISMVRSVEPESTTMISP